jgi:alkylation response protein AidB-like acyl-CoA dehydrogenase
MKQAKLPPQLADLDQLEQTLGDPFTTQSALSFATAMRYDHAAAFPEPAMAFLRQQGWYQYHVPQRFGGLLYSYQHQYHLLRALARRDVTVATAFVLHSIGYWPILIAGNASQIERYSQHVKQGEGISWSVTEREHGSDLMSTAAVAQANGDGFLLSGTKWPIGMCHYNRFTMFLAKTGERAGPDAFSLFCVDSQQHQADEFELLPLEKLYGVRGLPLSGVRLTQCPVESTQLIGEQGHGLELMLRNQQLARVGACALTTGSFDTALRITLSFAEQRRLFGRKLSEIAVTQGQLCDAFCDLLLCEVTMQMATRSLHFYPKMMFLWGAVAKYLVPQTLELAMQQLADILGARYYLSDSFALGLFQKILRDIGLAGFADGNKKVNLKNIALHMEVILPALAKGLDGTPPPEFAQLFDLFAPVPEEDYRKLAVFSGKSDPVFTYLSSSVAKLSTFVDDGAVEPVLARQILTLAQQIQQHLLLLPAEFTALKQQLQSEFSYSPESYRIAQKYAALHTGAALIHTLCFSQFLPPLHDLSWVPACLQRVLRWIDPALPFPSPQMNQPVMSLLQTMLQQQLAFSLIPLTLAETQQSFNCAYYMNTETPT